MNVNTRGKSLLGKALFVSAFPFFVAGKWVDANVRSYQWEPSIWTDNQLKNVGKTFLAIIVGTALLFAMKGYGREVLEIIGAVTVVVMLLWGCRSIFLQYDDRVTEEDVARVKELLDHMARAKTSYETPPEVR
jgi:hypothetical protein